MLAISERARQFEKFVNRSIVFPLVLLLLFALIISSRVIVLMEAARSVDRSDKVIAQANSTLILAVDEQSGQRGYFVDGDPKFLQRYDSAENEIGPAFASLQQMVSENSDQLERVQEMRSQFTLWQNEASYEMNVFSAYPDSYRSYFDQGREKSLMDTLRMEFASFIDAENQLRSIRATQSENATGATLIWSAILAVLFGLGLSVVWIRQTREFADQYEEALNVSQRNLSLLSATLMSIGDAVLVTDSRGKVMQMNQVAENLTGWRFADAYGMDADLVFRTVDRESRTALESPIKRVTADSTVVAITDKANLIRQDGKELSIDDSCSPIRNDAGKTVGAVLVFRDVTEREKAETELARLYEREHRIAEHLQRSLLSKPDPQLFPMLEIETVYQPAWAEANVGGDYFDIISLGDGKAALVVGDVSGKGLKAASRTAEMKFTLRAYLRESSNVANSISRLNAFVCQSHSNSDDTHTFFLCLTAVVIDTNSGDAEICVCGSEPPLVVRAGGFVEEIDAAGSPIGAFETSEFTSTAFHLYSGDMLMITTDGITEARTNKEFLGNEGLGEFALSARRKGSLVEIGEAIIRQVKEYADGGLSDDICLLIARQK